MIKAGLAQIKVISGRPDLNVAKMLEYMEKAATAQVDVLVFPEFTIPGSLLGDTWEDQAFLTDCGLWGQKIIAATGDYPNMTVIFGNVVTAKDSKGQGYRHNAAFTAQNGRLLGRENYLYPYRVKTRLPFSKAYVQEAHYFTNNEEMALRDRQELVNLLVPVEATIQGGGYNIGCITCADGWGSAGSWPDVLKLMNTGTKVDFFVNISASYFVNGKNVSRVTNFANQAQRNKTPILYVNQVGTQNNGKTIYAYDGNSCIYDATGRITAAAGSWQEELLVAPIPLNSFLPELAPCPDDQASHLYDALVYGIQDFSAARGIQKVVVGLSGGIDSAVVACLLQAALGAENVLALNMPSPYNAQATQDIAKKIAHSLGIRYGVIPISESIELTQKQLEEAPITDFGHKKAQSLLTLSPLAKENIQARDRGSRLLAAAAAAFGGAAVCCANKTELTVGYSTLYGDLIGYLAPIGDLWKYQVYELANYINQQFQTIPKECLALPPSAELSADQSVDQGLGDPLYYPYHDYLFRSWVEAGHDISTTLSLYIKNNLNQTIGCTGADLNKACPSVADFIADLEKWWLQFKGLAVAKRLQAPAILAVSRCAFGFDLAECQNGFYFTQKYLNNKALLLGK